jgi:type I restriction enzyme S subunit
MNNSTLVSFDSAPFDIIDGDRGKNYPKQNDFFDDGYCLFLNTTNVTPNGFNFSKCQFINQSKDSLLKKGKLERNDIVVTTRGTIGNCGYYGHNIEYNNLRINSGMVILRCNQQKLLPKYLYCFLRSALFHNQTKALKSGAAQPQLPIRDMKRIKIPLISIDKQAKISSIITAYDELIENNTKRIQLLEKSAHLLYKEWFINLRFPGHEHVKIIDGVPEGWEKCKLGEISFITMGQSPKSIYYNQDKQGLPFHQGVTNFGNRFPSHETYCTKENRIATPGDILFSVRAPVGRINITLDKIIIGRGLASIRSNIDQQNFLFYALKNYFFKENMIGGGAIFASITKKDLHEVTLIQPTSKLVKFFSDYILPIDQQIATLSNTNDKLTKARDLLLPRLMNGEIKI